MGNKKVAALLLGGLGLAAVAGLLLLCLPAKDLREPPAFKYGIVLDAGSSHTAMFVYKWPADKENDTGIVSQHSACDVDGGGISSYVADPSAAGRSLTACLDQAQVDVPQERHAATPLYLGATAGMRLLNLADPAASDRVLAAVSATMKQYPFDFRGARILSGEDEGVFGWVTANYLLENFIKYGWIGRWVRPKKKTLGAMDLGGASTQITFETPEVIESRPANEATLRLYGQTYKVYTHSFLCYGRDQILKRLLSKVLKAERYVLQLSNPCWPVGYGKNFTVGSIYDSPCTEAEKPASYFPTAMVNMSGSGNAAKCLQHVDSLFQFTACPYSHCSFDQTFQPSVTGNFIAFSAFFYTVDFIRSQMKRRVAMPSDLEQAAHEICSATWSEAGDASIGWALGYMLNLTNMIPAEETGFWKGTAYGPWVGLVLLFVAIILATLASIFCLLRSSKGWGGM